MMDITMGALLLLALYLVCASSYTYGRVKERESQLPAIVESVPESEVIQKLQAEKTELGYQNLRLSKELERLTRPRYHTGKAVITHDTERTRRRRHPLS